jgi:hypothetical protein
MSEMTEWVRGTLAGRREAEERPPGSVVPSVLFHKTFSVRAKHSLLVATDGRERLIGGEDLPMHDPEDRPAGADPFVVSTTEPGPRASPSASEHGSSRLPYTEDGVFIVDANSGRVLEALPLTTHRGAERINGDVASTPAVPRRWKASTTVFMTLRGTCDCYAERGSG